MIIRLIFIIALFFYSFSGYSQIPEINISADTNNVLIGDQIKILLEVKDKNKFDVIWTAIPDSLGTIEVVRRSKIDTLKNDKGYSLKQNVLVTSFDGGTYALPSFTFTFLNKDKTQDTVYTESLYLKFNAVEVDTTQEIKDIKGPLEVPLDWKSYLIYLLILIVLIIGGYFGYKYWKNRRKVQPDLGYDPSIPPYILALEALKQLESEKLWQGGYVKKYFIKLTDIVRVYIERQFPIKAMEMVTPDIISELRKNNFEQNLINDMSELFSLADFVKFAKHQPLPDENSKCMNYAVNFVKVSSQMQKDEVTIRQAQDDKQIQDEKEIHRNEQSNEVAK